MHTREPGSIPVASPTKNALLIRLRCDSVAPFGNPVVPLVNWIFTASSIWIVGDTDSSRLLPACLPLSRIQSNDRQPSCLPAIEMTCRSSGRGGAFHSALPPVSQLRDKLADHCDIIVGLEASSGYQRATSHRQQDVFQLAQAIGGIDVDKDQTGFRRRELRDRPFRAVRGPNPDPISGLQAEGQKPRRECVGTRFELGVGPANLLVRNDQRFARPSGRAHLVQEGADGFPNQRRSTVAMHVAFVLHEYLPSITKFIFLRRPALAAQCPC